VGKKLFYLHIPKTGGQTLATRIASAFPIGRSSIMGPDLTYPDGIESLKLLFDAHDFVERHVNGPVLRDLKYVDVLMTVRDPVKQITSNYLHILREPASPLHRPAKLLTPQAFFSQFGDLLANRQARYFISAFRNLYPDIERLVTWTTVMLDCLSRVRWYVPTEAIDEFCMLWQLEMNRKMLLPDVKVNIAELSSTQRGELDAMVAGMPELYSIDLLLWQIARQRYDSYKRQVLATCINNPYPDNWGHAWSDGDYGIWLGRGWHRPETTNDGQYAWWTGPDRLSEIYINRNKSHRYLLFSIRVYCGVCEEDVILITSDGRVLVSAFRRINDAEVVYAVDIGDLSDETMIQLRVPEVWSPVMVDPESRDTARKSVLACKWVLSATSPLELDARTSQDSCENIRNLHAGDNHGRF